jgi:hypothetical protein
MHGVAFLSFGVPENLAKKKGQALTPAPSLEPPAQRRLYEKHSI